MHLKLLSLQAFCQLLPGKMEIVVGEWLRIIFVEGCFFMKKIDAVAMVLIIIGAFNWGFIGIFGIDLVDRFVERAWLDRIIYMLMGFAGLFKVIYWTTGKWTTHFSEGRD